MFDIGIGEIMILAIVGLLVFGPEKLPKAAADAVRMLRNVRSMAANARKDLADSAGLNMSEAAETVRGLADLHPRRLVNGIFAEDEGKTSSARADSAGADSSSNGQDRPSSSPTRPVFDPDAT